jgi:hypothetical protein
MNRLSWLAITASLGSVGSLISSTTARADDEVPPLSIYGFARLDVLADDARLSDIAQPMYVPLASPTGNTGELTMTPRLSRIGLSIDPWELSSHTTGEGKLEVDFAGGSGTNAIRLRQAYASIQLQHLVELVAGQTTDLISPLFPSAQNDTQLLFAGNTGDRRPQVQLSVTPGDRFRVAIGVAPNGLVSHADADHDGQLDGTASMRPMLQWLAEYRQRMHGDVLRFGVWGHAASSELADGTQYTGASAGMHLYVPVVSKMVWLGEAYFGTDLADIGGGIDQGYSVMTHRTIHGAGGWFEIATLPSEHHMLAVGGSVDSARASDLSSGDRELNNTFYGVLRYKPLTALQLGVEYVYWRTRYKDLGATAANRFDLHLSVFF